MDRKFGSHTRIRMGFLVAFEDYFGAVHGGAWNITAHIWLSAKHITTPQIEVSFQQVQNVHAGMKRCCLNQYPWYVYSIYSLGVWKQFKMNCQLKSRVVPNENLKTWSSFSLGIHRMNRIPRWRSSIPKQQFVAKTWNWNSTCKHAYHMNVNNYNTHRQASWKLECCLW